MFEPVHLHKFTFRFLKDPLVFRKMTDKSSTEGPAIEGAPAYAVEDNLKPEEETLQNALWQNVDAASDDINFQEVPLDDEKDSEITT